MLKHFYFYLFSLIFVHNVASLPNNLKETKNDSDRRTKKDAVHSNICTSDICMKESTEIINSLNAG